MSAVLDMMLPDDRRHPLVAGSRDWDKVIIPALHETVSTGFLPLEDGQWHVLRVIIETIYVMGYERGQKEAKRPPLQFVVSEEASADDTR